MYMYVCEMAAERSGFVKRRSWRKRSTREKVVNLDHVDVLELVNVKTCATESSNSADNLQRPEFMSNNTLIETLKGIKVTISKQQPSRDVLLRLFHKHVTPKPQRGRFWRRRRKGKREIISDEDIEIDCYRPSFDSCCGNWESSSNKKR